MLDRTRLEKELAVADAVDKVHREFFKDEYNLSHPEEHESVVSRDRFQMKSRVHASFHENANDDPYKNMFASKQYIDESQVKYRNMATTKPSTTVPIKVASFMPPSKVHEPLPDLSYYKDHTKHKLPSEKICTKWN